MAVGVTEQDVFGAADAVLARGERPTYERVRAELGRGSPARVGQLLEAWWSQLAHRLARQLALPAIPDAVSVAFAQAWEAALAAGQAHAEALVAPERAKLADIVSKADAAVGTERAQRYQADQAAQQARMRADVLAAQVGEQQARLADQAAQLVMAAETHVARQATIERLEATLTAAEQARETERHAAAAERTSLQAHVRQVEYRAAAEVDRAREEIKRLRAEAKATAGAHAEVMRRLQRERDAAVAAQHAAAQKAVAAEAVARTLRAGARSSETPRKRAVGTSSPKATAPKRRG